MVRVAPRAIQVTQSKPPYILIKMSGETVAHTVRSVEKDECWGRMGTVEHRG